jgi:hypothetical protein
LAAHAVPEPVTHSLISMGEDFSVVGLLLLAYNYPLIAIGVVGAMILAMLILIPFLYRALKALAGKLMKLGEAAGGETAQLS